MATQKPATDEGSSALHCYPFPRSPHEVRIQWMRLYGLSVEEITKSLSSDPPTDIVEEERKLDSVLSIRERNADRCRSGCVVDKALEEFANNTTGDY